jgi:pimeloyl-ACP methyl ester carboxylesterase
MKDFMRRIILYFFISLFFQLVAKGQRKVSFPSADGLTVTADLYLKDPAFPFILLFHQGNCSRGEYKEIAPKLLNLNYNCLSVDLRSGGKVNFIENETCLEAAGKKIPHSMLDARTDIQAAIRYAGQFNTTPVVLFGSSYSASLSLIEANRNPHVRAVVAFSPGEFFRPGLIVKEALKDFDKRVFIAITTAEYEYVVKMLTEIPDSEKTFFTPNNAQGVSGAKALWESSAGNQEYWLALFMFFKELNGTGTDHEKAML